MTTRGKSINLFLMDGTPTGIIKCTLANWTGLAYKIPRTELDKCKGRDDLSQSGVYFLFGTSDESGKGVVYIGQAGVRKSGEGLLGRLVEHKKNPEKNYWTEAIVFTTSNNSFGPTEISYLENRFCRLATDAKRYEIQNSNDPTSGNITEEKESELEEFIDYAKIVMGTLGHRLFEPLTTIKQKLDTTLETSEDEDLLLFMKRKTRRSNTMVDARCKQTNEGFVVLKGSRIETIGSDSIPYVVKESRHNAKIDKEGILQEDILCSSPSYAAAFVIGGHANGLIEWKTKDGKSLKEVENTDDIRVESVK
ncbi:methionine sulfoxide reductase [Paenibacillus sp. CAA11]|uniref:GIY-YIG nuclease family protein n=1 Tax=Paenibacillus sp. CAA11 TaxID=1532905 RepID=UPI000D34F394|nr:GIY-YIG nuclease family protein [Paenibacillus sp. CAA11]AWB45531.1 methionine sulfoxide reductase [Paenibacillus sp. CAA11]